MGVFETGECQRWRNQEREETEGKEKGKEGKIKESEGPVYASDGGTGGVGWRDGRCRHTRQVGSW